MLKRCSGESVLLCHRRPASFPAELEVEGQCFSLSVGGWAAQGSLGALGMCLLGLRVIRTAAESPSEKFKGGILWLEMSVCDSRV